ncbi:MAG: NRDE family protein [Verrucomicrobiota bacterium]
MCTLSWWIGQEARGVFFNRDEKRTRSRGQPPEVVASQQGELLMPVDPDAGGTWIGANQHGVIIALLNNYPHYQEARPEQHSRGQLVVELLKHARSAAECMTLLAGETLSRYRGFLLFAMDSETNPLAVEWAGKKLEPIPLLEAGGLHLLTTSSVRREECEKYRRHLFCCEAHTPDYLRAKHQHFQAEDPALGPLMVRDDAATDSIVEIRLDPNEVDMQFQSTSGYPPQLSAPLTAKLPRFVGR